MTRDVEKDYEEYLERYATTRGISKEEAEKHLMVIAVKEYYESEGKG